VIYPGYTTVRHFDPLTQWGYISRLTGSELQGQEEAVCVCPANATTGVLFTGTNAVKFPSTVTWSSCTLPLSYYSSSTFYHVESVNLR